MKNSGFKNKIVKIIFLHLLIAAGMAVYILLVQALKTFCLFRFATKIPCPLCGTTRSIIALAKLNIREALAYQPMLLIFFILIFFVFHRNTPMLKKVRPAVINKIIIIGSSIILLFYLLRLFFWGFGPV